MSSSTTTTTTTSPSKRNSVYELEREKLHLPLLVQVQHPLHFLRVRRGQRRKQHLWPILSNACAKPSVLDKSTFELIQMNPNMDLIHDRDVYHMWAHKNFSKMAMCTTVGAHVLRRLPLNSALQHMQYDSNSQSVRRVFSNKNHSKINDFISKQHPPVHIQPTDHFILQNLLEHPSEPVNSELIKVITPTQKQCSPPPPPVPLFLLQAQPPLNAAFGRMSPTVFCNLCSSTIRGQILITHHRYTVSGVLQKSQVRILQRTIQTKPSVPKCGSKTPGSPTNCLDIENRWEVPSPSFLPLTPGSFRPKKNVMQIGKGLLLASPETPRPRKDVDDDDEDEDETNSRTQKKKQEAAHSLLLSLSHHFTSSPVVTDNRGLTPILTSSFRLSFCVLPHLLPLQYLHLRLFPLPQLYFRAYFSKYKNRAGEFQDENRGSITVVTSSTIDNSSIQRMYPIATLNSAPGIPRNVVMNVKDLPTSKENNGIITPPEMFVPRSSKLPIVTQSMTTEESSRRVVETSFKRMRMENPCVLVFAPKGHLQKHKRSVGHYNKVNINATFGAPTTANPRPFKCSDLNILQQHQNISDTEDDQQMAQSSVTTAAICLSHLLYQI
ncbi:unnamed protein product [Lepeophtheirus salmonis]|uniref:(salmon louse) hypothetical protein n=1 Tax=Lepeophtheirus salmonis TaxID=72036 RepID=A0A7R8H4J8_LEPSM|nr:unnamed protein product [Lepeophtheirus salmonis]CAF2860755.1 unnamed protein product [Lepeophtheirus salmonis]